MKKRLIAIHLPQFYPFKENNKWWGNGFTEWTNVTKAKPRFKGHYQPHLPADTGFYDLRLPESRQMQADMAKEYGIFGFCYYHYWFKGFRMMEKPVQEILKSKEPAFPFMLCWANETWSRNWDANEKDILLKQEYSFDHDEIHFNYLCKNVFSDPRYIRINNKPFLVIYRPALIPNIKETVCHWRDIAMKNGEELYLGFMRANEFSEQFFLDSGFDISIDFQPSFNKIHRKWWFDINVYKSLLKKYILHAKRTDTSIILDYKKYVENQIQSDNKIFKQFPGITPNWDNSPRRVGMSFHAFKNSTPALYGKWLKHILDTFEPYSEEENFIFINAWNEWAEGNHLEPDQKWGYAYLEETKKCIQGNP